MQTWTCDTVDSTNAEATRRLAAGDLACPACVVAREQTAGRGTGGRTWCSPRDAGIYLSVVDRPAVPTAPTVLFTLAAGVACAGALADATGVPVELRPINDLWVDGRKLGGILVETVVEAGVVTSIIAGVGINVRDVPRAVAAGAAPPVSLANLLSTPAFAALEIDELVRRLAADVAVWLGAAARGDGEVIRRAWAARSVAGAEIPGDARSQ